MYGLKTIASSFFHYKYYQQTLYLIDDCLELAGFAWSVSLEIAGITELLAVTWRVLLCDASRVLNIPVPKAMMFIQK